MSYALPAYAATTKAQAMAQANLVMQSFVSHYWQADNSLFYNNYPFPQTGNNYWWEANAIDALAEGVQLHLKIDCATYIQAIYQRIAADGSAITAYFDDENWMGLGLLHAYRATGQKEYLASAEQLYRDIYTHGWQKQGGVVWNRIGSTYRNTPANAPAALLGAELFAVTHNKKDLAIAQKIYGWEWTHLVGPHGTVFDGLQGRTLNKTAYTYNYGTVIGASLQLWRDTHDAVYLHHAELVANRSIAVFTQPHSLVLTPTGQGDGGLFKGIYVRYLAWMPAYFPKDPIYRQLLLANAQAVWSHDRTSQGLFDSNWARKSSPPPGSVIGLSTELSAVFLFNQIPGLY